MKMSIKIMLSILFSVIMLFAENLYVYYPNPVKSKIIQEQFLKNTSGIDIKVFGRYKDFKGGTRKLF